MSDKSLIGRLLYLARDFRNKELFRAIRQHAHGKVLDVGGWDFFLAVRDKGVSFDRWVTLEPDSANLPQLDDDRFEGVAGDGCDMEFADNTFDTVLSVQVMEHVFEPIKMLAEIHRVLKPGGKAIILLPQTCTLHWVPHHYQNFTRYWMIEAARRLDAELLEHTPMGGAWSTLASRLIHHFLQVFRYGGMSYPEARRNVFFYLLFPFSAAYALVTIPIALLFSLGDVEEEANNHLSVLRKKGEIAT